MCSMLTCSGITRGRDSYEYRGPAPPARQISAHLKRGRQLRQHPSFRGMLNLLFPKSRSVPVSAYPPIPPVEVGTTFAADHGDSEGAGEPMRPTGLSPNPAPPLRPDFFSWRPPKKSPSSNAGAFGGRTRGGIGG
jgi:hypothetical protein